MRAAVWILSGLLSIAICVLTGLAAVLALATSEQLVPVVLASGGAAVGLRLQQALRRICYLDEDRILSLTSTMVASLVLFGSYLFLSSSGASVELALACWALSTTSGAAMMTIRAHRFAKPGFRFTRWFAMRLLRGGKWLVPSSLLFWLSNYSLLPLAAQVSGLEFAGVLRVIQTLFSPLQQGMAAIMSVMAPRVAHQLASEPDQRHGLIWRLVWWAACLSAAYCVAIFIAGPVAGSLIFPKQAEHISMILLAIFAVTATSDAVRSAVNVVLIASGGERVIWSARLWGTAVFLVALVAFMALEDLSVPLSVLAGAVAGSLLSLLLARPASMGPRT